MNRTLHSLYVFFLLTTALISAIFFLHHNSHVLPAYIFQEHIHSRCLPWQSTDFQCIHYSKIDSIILTHQTSGFLKYLQWIIIRKLSNLRITYLHDNCSISHQNQYSPIESTHRFIQIYILPLTANFIHQSNCQIKIKQMSYMNFKYFNHIYFTRRSFPAILFYQQLDSLTQFSTNSTTQNIQTIFNSISTLNWTILYEEDFVHSKLDQCEHQIRYLFSLLKLDPKHQLIQYDSHRFLADATWWDHSQVAETIINKSVPSRPTRLTYINDFYHLHGQLSFTQYLYQNRQCFRQGIFTQLQSQTKSNRTSTDVPDRCLIKPFDCAFSDIYSFTDREQFYEPIGNKKEFTDKSLKCGFTIPSVFDQVRKRYARNETCETIIFTSITNCYDPLPEVKSEIPPSFCFVALLDTKTVNAYKTFYANKPILTWDLIDLGPNITLFLVAAKTAETMKIVGEHMFPLAKWIIWLDGKGRMNDIVELLIQAQSPFLGAPHPDPDRTSASEVEPTIGRVSYREKPFSIQLNTSVDEIKLQEKEYQRDGFYNRSKALGLKMYDIAVILYRNNHPCISRFLCGWHNEVNYYSYRGQLSVYYSAVRLNLTEHLTILAHKFYSSVAHQAVC